MTLVNKKDPDPSVRKELMGMEVRQARSQLAFNPNANSDLKKMLRCTYTVVADEQILLLTLNNVHISCYVNSIKYPSVGSMYRGLWFQRLNM